MTEPLPDDIPTVEEILASTDILHQHNCLPQKIVRVRNYAIKIHCKQPSFEDEPEHLRLLSQYPGLNVPKIYTAFEDSTIWPFDHCARTSWKQDLKVYYLVLDFIPGDTLENRGPNLSPEQHLIVQRKLRDQFQILRSIKLPQPYFGHHGNRRYPSSKIIHFSNIIFGPYTDEESFLNAIANCGMEDEIQDDRKQEFRYALKVLRESPMFRGSSPTLTHGDLQNKNIMMTTVGKAREGVEYDLEGEEDIIVSLIDWETMLWAPEWYQYCSVVNLFGAPAWWNDLMTEALGPYYGQLFWWRRIHDPCLKW